MNGLTALQNPATAAHHAQNQGRGNDSMLVHMSPNEVKGLQALAMAHGGSLTINPKTGLPEAGFLSSILPVVAGAALNFAFPGSGALIGLGIGGATALATGSLGKGLMAGLGAYGGANLGEGLVGAGSIGAEQAGTTAAQSAALQQANQMQLAQSMGFEGADISPWNMAAIEEAKKGAVEEFAKKNVFDQLGASAAQIGQQPLSSTMAALGGKSTALALAPTALGALASLQPKPPALQKRQAYIRPQDVNITNLSGQVTPYSIGDSSEKMMLGYGYSPRPIYAAAQGGVIDPDYNMDVGGLASFSDGYAEGGETGLDALAKKRKSLKGDPYYKFAQDRRDSSMQASLDQNFAAGGLPPRFLSGGGDGMSDSIKANIDGRQEARLADGEFVVPADVVSHLGNGSSKAGAKKLYSMMDKIRKARTGKTSQAPQVNAAKYMPA